MIKNYLKISLRNLLKNKVFSVINIFGLAVGFTCCILMALYIRQELSYDQFHENAERIYRILVETIEPDERYISVTNPFPLGPAYQEDYPEIEAMSRFYSAGGYLVEANDLSIALDDVAYVDPAFLQIFTYEVLQGDATDPLGDHSSIVLTRSVAERFFGEKNPVGATVVLDNQFQYQVSAVIADVPVSSHLTFEALIPIAVVDESITGFQTHQWGAYTDLCTYVLLPESVDSEALTAKSTEFLRRHAKFRPSFTREVRLQPLLDIHLKSHYPDELRPNNFLSVLIIVGTIGAFILLIACINFVNLSTARSARRAKEVGIRKTVGAARSQLVQQFVGESLLVTLLAFLTSLGLTELLLPGFSQLVGTPVVFELAASPAIPLLMLTFALLVGLLAGTYPAMVLSRFDPVRSLKAVNTPGRMDNPTLLRRILVISQFVISIALIIGTIVVQNQLTYMRTANLGFEREHIVKLPIFHERGSGERYQTYKTEFSKVKGVLGITAAFRTPIDNIGFDTNAYPEGYDSDRRFSINLNFIDYDYIDHFGLKLVAGRNFSPEFPGDAEDGFIVNEATTRRWGFSDPAEALGKKLPTGVNRTEGTIVGVVEDFHIASMRAEIAPFVMLHWPRFYTSLCIKIRSDDTPATMAELEEIWNRLSPDFPFDYQFLDEQIDEMYRSDAQAARIIAIFSLIAIFIACLGLLGLATYAAEQRTKEIGVRKVLGASLPDIVILLSSEFVIYVLIAAVLASPLAYFGMSLWLQDFVYKISISPVTMVYATLTALLIALGTISFQSVKAARANPVDSLKYE